VKTRCPNPCCAFRFEVPAESAGKNGPCPACGQVITYRSLDLLLQLDRQRERMAKAHRAGAPRPPPPAAALTALLEDVRSLWNVGAIFRTADGAGFQGLYLCGITGVPPRPQIAKTSLGAEEVVPWTYEPGALAVLPKLKARGVLTVGLEWTGKSELLSAALARGALRRPLCLAVGNEVAGLSAETLAACDLVCHLPMRGVKTSLNVAVAFGIAAYQIGDRFGRVE
jgi:tRNA G18 (ribose-2'-O)-methylase SpoU